MRILALTLVLLAVLGIAGITVTVLTGEEAEAVPAKTIASETAPADPMPVRPLLPMPTAVDTATSATSLREASSDAPLVLAALYWVLLGAVAVRRVSRLA